MADETERMRAELEVSGLDQFRQAKQVLTEYALATEGYALVEDVAIQKTNEQVLAERALNRARLEHIFGLDQETEATRRATSAQQANTAAKQAGAAGTRNVGMAALEASRAIEDLQYGFAGVVNNIPSLVMALGGGMGLTAVISLAAIGINQLVKHLGDLASAFGSTAAKEFTGQIETLTKRIKEIEEKKIKLSVDTQELEAAQKQLDEIKKNMAALEAARESKSKAESEAGGIAKEIIAEAGGKKISDALYKQAYQELEAESPEMKENKSKIVALQKKKRAAFFDPDIGSPYLIQGEIDDALERRNQIRNDLAQRASDQAGKQLREGQAGGQQGLRNLADALSRAGQGGTAAGIQDLVGLEGWDQFAAAQERKGAALTGGRERRGVRMAEADAQFKAGLRDIEQTLREVYADQGKEGATQQAQHAQQEQLKTSQAKSDEATRKALEGTGILEEGQARLAGIRASGLPENVKQAMANDLRAVIEQAATQALAAKGIDQAGSRALRVPGMVRQGLDELVDAQRTMIDNVGGVQDNQMLLAGAIGQLQGQLQALARRNAGVSQAIDRLDMGNQVPNMNGLPRGRAR